MDDILWLTDQTQPDLNRNGQKQAEKGIGQADLEKSRFEIKFQITKWILDRPNLPLLKYGKRCIRGWLYINQKKG